MNSEKLYQDWLLLYGIDGMKVDRSTFDKYYNEGAAAFDPNKNFYEESLSNPYGYKDWIANSLWAQGHYLTAKDFFEQKYEFNKISKIILYILKGSNLTLEGDENGFVHFKTPENYTRDLEN